MRTGIRRRAGRLRLRIEVWLSLVAGRRGCGVSDV